MEKIENYLTGNGCEFIRLTYGNEYYTASGIRVTFYRDGIGNTREQARNFAAWAAKNRRAAVSIRRQLFQGGEFYDIMPRDDAEKVDAAVKLRVEEAEAYWQAEHARRIAC